MTRRISLITISILCLAAFVTLLVRIEMQEYDKVPAKADAVIVLAGRFDEDLQRLAEGVRLVEQGFGGCLILPLRDRGLSWKTLQRIYGIHTTIPVDKVLIGRPEHIDPAVLKYCGGTFSEAAVTVRLMRANTLSSAVVVSSRYHIPRVRLAFQKINSNGSLTFSYLPVGEPETGKLLSSAYALAKRLIEYGKFFTALFMYPIGAEIMEYHRPE